MTEAVVAACLLLAVAAFVFAFLALYRDKGTKDEIKNTVKTASDIAAAAAGKPAGESGLGDQAHAQAALGGGLTDYIKALAELSGSLSKLSQAIAAMFMGFALVGLAAGVALVDGKVPDKKANSAQDSQKKVPNTKTNSTQTGQH
ncbi:MAG: hypothetical protein M3155_00645 [Actinomycetota bacterium]|nr:hypothetical protein [Actinomycetota bacterium]